MHFTADHLMGAHAFVGLVDVLVGGLINDGECKTNTQKKVTSGK